jgi:DNA-binding MarR family transcriptional regulator
MIEDPFGTTDDFPTDPMGWLLSLCSMMVRNGLTTRFADAGHNVTPEQWSILSHLWQNDGLTQQNLANRFHRSKVAAFHLISKLEEQGLIVRLPNPGDGRSNLIYLTPQGKAVVGDLIPVAQANLDKALEGVSQSDEEAAKAVLRRIIVNLKT